MNLYFNDLTVTDSPEENKILLRKFVQLFSAFSELTGEQRTWVPRHVKERLMSLPWTVQDMNLWSWANAAMGLKGNGAPVESESVSDRYLTSDFFININEERFKCDQMGLAALSKPTEARSSLTLGFSVNDFWRGLSYRISEVRSGGCSTTHSAVCVVSLDQLTRDDVREWCQLSYVVKLPLCQKRPEDKPIHLRDDHGSDVLLAFSKKIVRSPYVEQIVNSLPFNSSGTKFIEKVFENGVIYIRIIQDPRGVGLAVQTTARCLDHAERIARILDRIYR